MSNTSRISQISTRVPVNTRQSNLQLNKMDEGAFRNMSFSGRQCSISSIRRDVDINRHVSPESHRTLQGGGQSYTIDPLGYSMVTKGQQRRESNAAITLDLALALNSEKALRKYSFEQSTASPNRSRRESINIMANSPKNSIFGISNGVSNASILNKLERLEREQRFRRKLQKICSCFGL